MRWGWGWGRVEGREDEEEGAWCRTPALMPSIVLLPAGAEAVEKLGEADAAREPDSGLGPCTLSAPCDPGARVLLTSARRSRDSRRKPSAEPLQQPG